LGGDGVALRNQLGIRTQSPEEVRGIPRQSATQRAGVFNPHQHRRRFVLTVLDAMIRKVAGIHIGMLGTVHGFCILLVAISFSIRRLRATNPKRPVSVRRSDHGRQILGGECSPAEALTDLSEGSTRAIG